MRKILNFFWGTSEKGLRNKKQADVEEAAERVLTKYDKTFKDLAEYDRQKTAH